MKEKSRGEISFCVLTHTNSFRSALPERADDFTGDVGLASYDKRDDGLTRTADKRAPGKSTS